MNFKTVKWSGNIGNGSLEILADTTFLRTNLDDRAKNFRYLIHRRLFEFIRLPCPYRTLPFFRFNANFSYKRVPYLNTNRFPFFEDWFDNIWWNLLEKREAYLYEKAIKTDIYAARFLLITVNRFKKRNFSSMLRTFYKNTQIYTPVRWILGKKYGMPRA